MSKKKLDLTRRRVLGGLGTIGVASAAAGLGTSAYLNDTESFENNMMTAGELDLAVDYVVHEDQGDAGTYTINSFTDTVNGTDPGDDLTLNGDGTAMSQNLDDVKPGDSGHSRFCFRIDDNPAYMWACGELTSSNENGYTEPEPEDDNGEGELEENIEVDVLYCQLHSDGSVDTEGETIFSGTLKEVLYQLSVGIPLDGTGTAGAMPGDQLEYAGTGMDDVPDDVTNPCLCFDWEVPTSVGNEIQGDSLMFDLQFYALQARHNDGTTNPCAPARTVSTGDGFSEISFDKALNMQALASGGSSRGEIQVHSDSGGVEDTNVYGNSTYPSNTDIPFTAEIDPTAQTASLTVNEVTVTDDDVTDGDANSGSTGDPEWPSGVPDYIDVSINASSASGNSVTTVVEDVVINGSPVSTSISENDGKEYLAVTNVDASSTATVEGTIRFEGSQSDYTTEDWVGIDFR